MPIYEEKTFSRTSAVLLIAICFTLIYPLFQITERELRWDEGYYAAMANEMDILKPDTVAQGELIDSYPLYPWFVSLLYKLPFGSFKYELGLRLISIFSIAALALIVWETARKAINEEAGFVAASAFISCILVVEKGLDGYPDMLGYVFVFSAWTTWFNIGAVKGRWDLAWVISFFFCGLAFYTIGPLGIFLFVFPLIFMRRPLTIWSRVRKPSFFAGLGILSIFIIIWGWPVWTKQANMPFRDLSLGFGENSDYMKQILTFPLEFPVRFIPWSLIAWPAFCVAYQPLDKNPVFSRFIRIIFVSLFFVLWFKPDIDWRNTGVLAAPLAILASIHYPLLVRRHGFLITWTCRRLSILVIVIAGSALLLHLMVFFDMIYPGNSSKEALLSQIAGFNVPAVLRGETFHNINLYAIAESLIVICVFTYMVKKKIAELPVWVSILVLTTGAIICYWILIAPFQAYDKSSRNLAKSIENCLISANAEKPVIYKSPEIKGLNAPFLYLDCTVKKLRKSFDEIPLSEKTVYAVGPNFPASHDRTWSNLTPKPLIYKKHELFLWEGTLTKKKELNGNDE